jgi:hypothetical protein
MLLTSFFISLYWPGSVIRSMAKKTWNFGLGALSFFLLHVIAAVMDRKGHAGESG